MSDRTLFSILIGVLTVLLIALGTYQYISFENIRETQAAQYRSFQQSLQDTQQRLNEDIATVTGELTTFQEDVQGGFHKVETAVNQTRQESTQQISHLSGQLGKLEQESVERITTLEDQVQNVRLSNKDFSAIIKDIIKSVVSVKTDKGIGSGVIFQDKYILTNKHVVEGASQAAIITFDEQAHPVQLIGMHNNIDLAVLKLADDSSYPSLEFEDKDSRIEAGAKVIAVGNPGGLEFSVTEGIISSPRREIDGVTHIQHDVPINPGNSGGPLVNINGNIVGINTKKRAEFESIGFAIHADIAEDIARQILQAAGQN